MSNPALLIPAIEICMGMGNAEFYPFQGVPMKMGTKLLKIMRIGRNGSDSDKNGNAYY